MDSFITDQRSLAQLADAITREGTVAIDTEFVRERTYYPELCLLQIGTDDWVACVDCTLRLELEPLLAALLAPDRTWLLHSARQDLEVVWNLAGATPARVLDTQVAAALVGFPPQVGLQALLSELLGIELDKSHTRTNWSRRPLPAPALAYAFDDVRFLPRAMRSLDERLEALGRREWFVEDCAALVATPPVTDLGVILRRLKSVARLSAEQRCAALALVEWRETRARTADKPRRWILADEQLVDICRALPTSAAALSAVAGLPRGLVNRSGREIIAAIERSDSLETRAAVEAIFADPKPERNALADLQEVVRKRARELGVHAELLATRREITALAAGNAAPTVMSGWRLAVLEADVGR